MALLTLKCGSVVQLDEADVDLILGVRWRLDARKRYVVYDTYPERVRNRTYMHRLIMQPGPDMVVDHIDGNGLNNRRSNLRVCTQQQNLMNRRNAASEGVWSSYGRWRACIRVDGKHYSLGTFGDRDEAQRVRNWAACRLREEFAPGDVISEYQPEMFKPRIRKLLF